MNALYLLPAFMSFVILAPSFGSTWPIRSPLILRALTILSIIASCISSPSSTSSRLSFVVWFTKSTIATLPYSSLADFGEERVLSF